MAYGCIFVYLVGTRKTEHLAFKKAMSNASSFWRGTLNLFDVQS
jgi:hypothetical protein